MATDLDVPAVIAFEEAAGEFDEATLTADSAIAAESDLPEFSSEDLVI